MITVRYIYSACVVTATPDIRLLHDPWFTDGIYDGSWYHFPKVDDPLAILGDIDAVFISHIHPDHYDPAFLHELFSRVGEKPILIAAHRVNYLERKMRVDGFSPQVLSEPLKIGHTTITIFPDDTGSVADVDSACVVSYAGERIHRVTNVNDLAPSDRLISKLNTQGAIDILLCGYAPASGYPQTFFDIDDPLLPVEAQRRKATALRYFNTFVERLQPRVTIPFAGQYVLGGKLTHLNPFRGVPDALEACDPTAIVLETGAELNTRDLEPTAVRSRPFDAANLRQRLEAIGHNLFAYEKWMTLESAAQLPFRRLLVSAAKRAAARSECQDDYFYTFMLPGNTVAVVNAKRQSGDVSFVSGDAVLPETRSEVSIDPRYLFGLLTGVYHWDNGSIGSLYETRRFPNLVRSGKAFTGDQVAQSRLNRQRTNYLAFLSVC